MHLTLGDVKCYLLQSSPPLQRGALHAYLHWEGLHFGDWSSFQAVAWGSLAVHELDPMKFT